MSTCTILWLRLLCTRYSACVWGNRKDSLFRPIILTHRSTLLTDELRVTCLNLYIRPGNIFVLLVAITAEVKVTWLRLCEPNRSVVKIPFMDRVRSRQYEREPIFVLPFPSEKSKWPLLKSLCQITTLYFSLHTDKFSSCHKKPSLIPHASFKLELGFKRSPLTTKKICQRGCASCQDLIGLNGSVTGVDHKVLKCLWHFWL